MSRLDDESVEVIWGAGEEGEEAYAAVVGATGPVGFLADLLAALAAAGVAVSHVETRGIQEGKVPFPIFCKWALQFRMET